MDRGTQHSLPGQADRQPAGALEPLRALARPGIVIAVSGIWGLVAGWWIPRGPLTGFESLATMVIALIVGIVSGRVLGSRWAMLLAPAVFAAVFEVTRLGTDGPTVDGVTTSTYGLLAFIVGRGFHGVVGLVPLVLGAAFGAGIARRRDGQPAGARRATAGRYFRRTVAAVTTVALIGLGILLSRPAATAPILDAGGQPRGGSIAELSTVDAGGKDLGLMLRGASVENPVLLFLAGGPGGSELGAMRNHLPKLEESFVVATWDQRGTGTSYPALDPTATLTLESSIADTVAVTNYLRARFNQDKIYLLGQSWGSLLGVLAAQRAPELYRAFIGTGQMVSPVATDRIFYEDTLAWAAKNGDTALVGRLREIKAPPYDRMLDYETALSYEHEVYPYDSAGNSEGPGGFSENFIVPEYTLVDQIHLLGAFMDTFAALYPQLQDIDFRRTATTLEVPVYFVQGTHEADGRAEPFREWYGVLNAPGKDVTELATSGHRPLFEQPDEFVSYMTNTVLARTPPS